MAKLVSFLMLKDARGSTMKRMFMRVMSHKPENKVIQQGFQLQAMAKPKSSLSPA
jgi:hypothetical protein